MNSDFLLSNRLECGSSVGVLLERFIEELEKEQELPKYNLYFEGGAVLALVSSAVKPRAIELKMAFSSLKSEEKRREVFEKIRSVWGRVVPFLPRMDLSSTLTKEGGKAQSHCCLQGGVGELSLQFSLHMFGGRETIECTTNADSLYLPAKEALMGKRVPLSREGEDKKVLSAIREKKLTSQATSQVQGGWSRVLCYLMEGWTIEDPSLLAMRSCDTLSNVRRIASETCTSSHGHFLFWANAVLHDPSEEMEQVVRRLYPRQWPPLPEEDVRPFLSLLLPLMATEVLEVNHLGSVYLQCCFEEGYVLVPKDAASLLSKEDLRGPFLAFLVRDKDLRKAIVKESDGERAKALLLLCPALSLEVLLSLLEEGVEVERLTKEEKERIDISRLASILCERPVATYERGFPLRPLLVGQKPKMICEVLEAVVERYGDTFSEASSAFFEDIDSLITPDFPLKPRQRLLALLAKPLYGVKEGRAHDLLLSLVDSLGGQVGEGVEGRMLDAVLRQDERALASLLKEGVDRGLLEGVERTLLDKALLILSENGYTKKALEYKPSLLLCPLLYQKSKKKEGITGYVKEGVAELSLPELLTLYVRMKQVPELLCLIEERLCQQGDLGKVSNEQKRLFIERVQVLFVEGKVEEACRLLSLLPTLEGKEECLLLLLERKENAPLLVSELGPLLHSLFRSKIRGRDKMEWHKAFIPVLEHLPDLRREGWDEYKKDKGAMEREREVTRFYLSALSAEERFLFSLECFSYQDLFNQTLLEDPAPFMELYEGWTEELLLGWFQSFVKTGREREGVNLILLKKLPTYFSKDVEPFFRQLQRLGDRTVFEARVKEQVARASDKESVIIRFFILHFYRLTGDLPKEFWQVARRYLDGSPKKKALLGLREGLQEYLDKGIVISLDQRQLLLELAPFFSPPLSFARELDALLERVHTDLLEKEKVALCQRVKALCLANPSHCIDVLTRLDACPPFLRQYDSLLLLKECFERGKDVLPPTVFSPCMVSYLCSQPRSDSLIVIVKYLFDYMKERREEGKIEEELYLDCLTRLRSEIIDPSLEQDVEKVSLGVLAYQLGLHLRCLDAQGISCYLNTDTIKAIGFRCVNETQNLAKKYLFPVFLSYTLRCVCARESDAKLLIPFCLYCLSNFFRSSSVHWELIDEIVVIPLLQNSLCYPWGEEESFYAVFAFTSFLRSNPIFMRRLRDKEDPLSIMEREIMTKAYDLWISVSDLSASEEKEPTGDADRSFSAKGIVVLLSWLYDRYKWMDESLLPLDPQKLIDVFLLSDTTCIKDCLSETFIRSVDVAMAMFIKERIEIVVEDEEKKKDLLEFMTQTERKLITLGDS